MDRRRDRIIRIAEVRHRTGLSTASIYRFEGDGRFPTKLKLSARMVGWYESDIDRWIDDPIGWQEDQAPGDD